MRLHRFFVPKNIEYQPNDIGRVHSLSDSSIIHQIEKVLKLRVGDKAIFFDGSGREHESEIVSLDRDKLLFRILETREVKKHSSVELVLAFSLIKKDNVEWIIQKCTELGVSKFIPVISERSEKKGFNIERAKKISIEACEQSGRGDIPKICEPMALADFLESEKRKKIVFDMSGEKFEKNNFANEKELVTLIGPEGGWSESEIKIFKQKGVKIVSINTPVLRAETAAVAVTTLLLA